MGWMPGHLLLGQKSGGFLVTVHGFKGSAPPLTAEAASLIEKETPALRSHIRGVQG
jgi:hypothetical protein